MKTPTLLLLLAAMASSASAQNIFANPDFSNGELDWFGFDSAIAAFYNGFADKPFITVSGNVATITGANGGGDEASFFQEFQAGTIAAGYYEFSFDLSAYAGSPTGFAFIKIFENNDFGQFDQARFVQLLIPDNAEGSYTIGQNVLATDRVQFGFSTTNVLADGGSYSFSNPVVQLGEGPPIDLLDGIPNGDFEIASGEGWELSVISGSVSATFPATGGAGNSGYARLADNGAGGLALLTANDGTAATSEVLPLAALGLSAGETYPFSVDMRIDAGANIGGLLVDFVDGDGLGGSTGYLFPTTVTTPGSFQTYTFDITIPTSATGITVSIVSGEGSTVCYDNVAFSTTPGSAPALTGIPNADFETPGGAGWNPDFGFGEFTFDFPTTGGNPDGYGEIANDTTPGGFGLFVSNNGDVLPLTAVGLSEGGVYTWSVDAAFLDYDTNFFGETGGIKIDWFKGDDLVASTNDIFFDDPGSAAFVTYTVDVPVPFGADGFKVVLLWGNGSIIGFDNVGVDPNPVALVPAGGIPNGDFAQGDALWFEDGDNFNTLFEYPTTGGSGDDGGYVRMDNSGGFGVMVSNVNAVLDLAALGLTPGKVYTFKQDMRLESGSSLGAFKVEFYRDLGPVGDSGELVAPVAPVPGDWNTYEYTVAIPYYADGIKVIPVAGALSVVGFDNITYNPTPLGVFPILNAGFDDPLNNYWIADEAGLPFTFPTTGGNPGGYASIVDTGGFGVLLHNNNQPVPLAELGVAPGSTVYFVQDWIALDGTGNQVGMKFEYFDAAGVNIGADSGDLLQPEIAGGDSWLTYYFEQTIPIDAVGIKVIPLWTPSAEIGIDNIGVVPFAEGPPSNSYYDRYMTAFDLSGGEAQPEFDADGDLIANIFEVLYQLKPAGAGSIDQAAAYQPRIEIDSNGKAVFTYFQDATSAAALTLVSPEGTDDLAGTPFTPLPIGAGTGQYQQTTSTGTGPNGLDEVSNTSVDDADAGPFNFFRVDVTE